MTPRTLGFLEAPRYPTRLEALADPGLLERALPAAWRRSEALGAVAAFALASQSACAPASCAPKSTEEPPVPPAAVEDKSQRPSVAPVTRHGDGTVAFGCVAVLPPAYLSEQEAFAIIRAEASKRGLNLEPPLAGVFVPKGLPEPDSGAFVPDLTDAAHRISVEFVDFADLRRFSDPSRTEGMAYTLDGQACAERVAEYVGEHGDPGTYFGALYGPAINPGSWSMDRNAMRAANEEMLRLQVRDFLDWLQAQGAL